MYLVSHIWLSEVAEFVMLIAFRCMLLLMSLGTYCVSHLIQSAQLL